MAAFDFGGWGRERHLLTWKLSFRLIKKYCGVLARIGKKRFPDLKEARATLIRSPVMLPQSIFRPSCARMINPAFFLGMLCGF